MGLVENIPGSSHRGKNSKKVTKVFSLAKLTNPRQHLTCRFAAGKNRDFDAIFYYGDWCGIELKPCNMTANYINQPLSKCMTSNFKNCWPHLNILFLPQKGVFRVSPSVSFQASFANQLLLLGFFNWVPMQDLGLVIITSCIKVLQVISNRYTGNNRFSGNDRFSGLKEPDRFFRYTGRLLYLITLSLPFNVHVKFA